MAGHFVFNRTTQEVLVPRFQTPRWKPAAECISWIDQLGYASEKSARDAADRARASTWGNVEIVALDRAALFKAIDRIDPTLPADALPLNLAPVLF